MLGWRRRNQGFEWRKYVRTTILVRRERRKERVAEARDAAIEGIQKAGRRGVEVGSAGIASAGGWFRRGLRRGGDGMKHGLSTAASGMRRGLARAGSGLRSGFAAVGPRLAPAGRAVAGAAEPGLKLLARPGIALSLALVTAVCAAAGGLRVATQGLDAEAAIPLSIAALCALLLLAGRLARLGTLPSWLRIPLPTLAGRGVIAILATVVLASAAGAWWWLSGPRTNAPVVASRTKAVAAVSGGDRTLSGRALARTGDSLRVSGVTLRLEGIEAPLPDQVCRRAASSRTWRCGQAARDALTRLVRSKSVTCEVSSRTGPDTASGTCRIDGRDVAELLVRQGHVFAGQGIFARYGTLEGEARAARAGLWAGEAERPEEYRARLWDDARKSAPDGCPIKAVVSSGDRVYLLPWSAAYGRARVRSGRGERWFCSEEEARAAGWRVAG